MLRWLTTLLLHLALRHPQLGAAVRRPARLIVFGSRTLLDDRRALSLLGALAPLHASVQSWCLTHPSLNVCILRLRLRPLAPTARFQAVMPPVAKPEPAGTSANPSAVPPEPMALTTAARPAASALPVKVEATAAAAVPLSVPEEMMEAASSAAEATAAAPVPPATTSPYSSDFWVACDEHMEEAVRTAIYAAKQTGYFVAQAAAYRAGRLGSRDDDEANIDAGVADNIAGVYADLAVKAAAAMCVTRATAVAASYTNGVIYNYDIVADGIKRDMSVEYNRAVALRDNFNDAYATPPQL